MKSAYPLAGLAVAILITAVSANASAKCWNNGCFNKDPVAAGCRAGAFVAKAATIKTSVGGVVGHVQLLYSPACGAAWGYVGSAVGNVNKITAQIEAFNAVSTGSGIGDLSCDNCSSKRSMMLGDAGTTHAWATGFIRYQILAGIYFTFKAKTGSF